MKKKVLLGMITALFLVSCGNKYDKITFNSENNEYELLINTKSNNSIDIDEIKFSIGKSIKDSLKLSDSRILEIANKGIENADAKIKHKMTYQYPKIASIYFVPNNNDIEVFFMGSAENSYGVRDKVMSFVCFDKNGEIIIDDNDLPLVR
ncbi:MAG: hypothetical protein M9897_07540 [Brumimicrobium sp.]|nr:hypothetical protein [Brumimicrobium sp.]